MAFFIYLIYVLDNVTTFLSVVFSFLCIATAASFLKLIITPFEDFDEDSAALWWKWNRRFLKWFIIITIPATFIPSSKTVAAMYLIPKIVENKSVQQLPDKALSILNLKLDQWMDGFKKKGK